MKNQKQIVYCSYDGLLDPLGSSQVLPYVYGISEKESYKFTIISFEKKKNYDLRKELSIILKSKNIDWIPLIYTKKPPILSTYWDVIKLKKNLKKILKTQKIDLIHCRSYITSLEALDFKKKHNIPFIFDKRGFYADERVDGKLWNKYKFPFNKIYNYFKKKEKEFLQYADFTISLTENGKKEIESWKLPNQSPIKVIPCCTDENLFQTKNISDKREELVIKKDDFILSYVGSLGTWYMLDEMLDFFKVLNDKKPSAKFLFITKDDPNLVHTRAEQKGIKKGKLIIKPSPRELMPSYIGVSDFSIFFILPVFSKKASSPTKMGEIMNLGIPIICNAGVGDVDNIMKECMSELLVKDFEKNEYERIVNLIFDNYKPSKEKIIDTSHQYYSLEQGVKRYKEVYYEILGV